MTPPTRLIIELTDHPSEAVLTVLRMGEQLRNERNHREARAAEQAPGDNS